MRQNTAKRIVKQFESRKPRFEALGKSVESLLKIALREVSVHSISYRVKDTAHLEEKLTRPGKNYRELQEVTDLLGVRIITYFEDDVDAVVQAVDREFQIDDARSEDKRRLLDPDRFGYVSVHKICEFSPERTNLTEYREFQGLFFEIQIRSILQHAWAEMEHDLGYKAVEGVPVQLRRRFSLLAGLLELADQEFIRIRKELKDYSNRVGAEIMKSPEGVFIDKISLQSFIQTSPACRLIDATILSVARAKPNEADDRWIEARVREFSHLGLRTIKDLTDSFTAHKEDLMRLAPRWFSRREYESLANGIATFLLVLVLIGKRDTYDHLIDGLEELNIGTTDELRAEMAKILYSTFHESEDPPSADQTAASRQ